MSIHCFYHSADLDGHCSGAIVKYRFPKAIMHPINYGDVFPWEEIGEEDVVYMVDFGLQPFDPEMIYLMNRTNLCWIDHHHSAIEEHRKWYAKNSTPALDYLLLEGIRDTSKSACELTWEYLFPDQPVPLAVKLLSLYDSWTYEGHELEPMVLLFQMRMRMESLDPRNQEAFDAVWISLFHDDPIEDMIEEGKLLLRYDEEQKRQYAQMYGFETKMPIRKEIWSNADRAKDPSIVPPHISAIALNIGMSNSKVFDSVWRKGCDYLPHIDLDVGVCPRCNGLGHIEPYDLMITFCRRSDRKWNVSLYSTKADIDCGAIAKSFGGGGHKGAAGFQCTELPFDY